MRAVRALSVAIAACGLCRVAAQDGCAPPPLLSQDYLIMSDAIGAVITRGKSTFDLGKFDECTSLSSAQYCIMTTSLCTYGVCVPAACSIANLTNPTNGVMDWLISQIPGLIFLDPYDAKFTCGNHARPWSGGGIAVLVVLSLLVTLVLTATAVDYYDRMQHRDALRRLKGDTERAPEWSGTQSKTSAYVPPTLNDMDTYVAYYSDEDDPGDAFPHGAALSRSSTSRPMPIPTAAGLQASPSINNSGVGSYTPSLPITFRPQVASSLGIMSGIGAAMPLVGSAPGPGAAGALAGSYGGGPVGAGLTLRARSFRPPMSSPLGMEMTSAGSTGSAQARVPSAGLAAGNSRWTMGSGASPVDPASTHSPAMAAGGTETKSRRAHVPRDRRRSSLSMDHGRIAFAGYDIFAGHGWRAGFKAFSLVHNLPRLFSMKGDRSGAFASLNGMRAFSMGLIILGHTITYMAAVGFVNWSALSPPSGAVTTWAFQIFPSSEFAVDTFLVLGGFLAAHALLKHVPQDSSSLFTLADVAFFVLHRVWRILPLYGLVIALNVLLVPNLSAGPFWFLTDVLTMNCGKYWWANILFVNNFVPWFNNSAMQCMGWTFYLAVDMQLYILTPFFVAIYLVFAPFAVVALLLLVIASIAAAGYVVDTNGLTAILASDIQLDANYSDMYFTKPWMRCPPYFIGILLAFLWDRVAKKRKRAEAAQAAPQNAIGVETFAANHAPTRYVDPYKWSKLQQGSMQLIAMALLAAVMYGSLTAYSTPSSWTQATHVAYTILTRPAWAVGITILLFVCFTQPGNLLNRLLGAPVWEPIARLTFGAYLVHPIVMQVFLFSSTGYFRYSALNVASAYCTNIVFSFVVAALLFLGVEKPLSNVEIVIANAFEDWKSRRARANVKTASELSDGGTFTPKGGTKAAASTARAVVISREDRAPLLQ